MSDALRGHRALPERLVAATGGVGPVRRVANPVRGVLTNLGRHRLGAVPAERAVPKTEHTGKTHRIIPLFPLLRPYLEFAFEAAAEGSVYVIPEEYRKRAAGSGGWANANLRTTLTKVIRRAGVEPWSRLWHSMRASCESDLAQSFPLAVVTKWLGNTPSVALRHYVDPTEAAFAQAATWVPGGGAKSGAPAAHFPAQQAPAENRTETTGSHQNADGEACYASPCGSVRDTEQSSSGGAGN
jgi:hypothetical protein